MVIRWTTDAADDLAFIVERIRVDDPAAAQRVARIIYTAILGLEIFPYRGRIGLVLGTRELVFAPWPYIAVYEVIDGHVRVLRIRHASQNWP